MIVPVLCYAVRREVRENVVVEINPWGEYDEHNMSAGFRAPTDAVIHMVPVIGHLHNDPGQEAPHYHIDLRYAEPWMTARFGSRIPVTPEIQSEVWLFKMRMDATDSDYIGTTNPDLVQKSEISCDHLIKGHICPHRGFDLSTVEPVDGVLTCPLHGLQFCAKTKKLLNKTLDDGINLHGS